MIRTLEVSLTGEDCTVSSNRINRRSYLKWLEFESRSDGFGDELAAAHFT